MNKRLYLVVFALFTFSLTGMSQADSVSANDVKEGKRVINIYVVKNYWHTGIILPVDSIAIEHLPALRLFDKEQHVDIGFGDRVFYLDPEYDIVLAARAIAVPTESTVRISALAGGLKSTIRRSDYAVKIKMKLDELLKLCNYINNSIAKENNSQPVVIEKRAGGGIIYFEGNQKYHLFNTCNTWVADALNNCGLAFISPANVITSHHLFDELVLVGEALKVDTSGSVF